MKIVMYHKNITIGVECYRHTEIKVNQLFNKL